MMNNTGKNNILKNVKNDANLRKVKLQDFAYFFVINVNKM